MELPLNELIEHFNYLDGLRESGVTNMFGAGSYLEKDMGCDMKTAKAALKAWMETFDNRSPQERAEDFVNKNKTA